MHVQAVLSLALAGLAMAAPQAQVGGPRPTPDHHWRPTPEHHRGATKTTTRTLTAYTTYCPEPTTLDFNGKKYTVTKETTLTITDCPCTVVETGKPAPPKTPAVVPPPKSHAAPPAKTPDSAPPSKSASSPPVASNPASPNPPSKVSGAEGTTARFGLAVVAGAALAGLMAL